MKTSLKKLFIIFNILLFLIPINIFALDFKVYSKKAIFINLNEDKVLYSKNENDKTYIASLTKMMTAIVAIEKIEDLNKEVTILNSDINELPWYAATSSLKVNTKYTYMDLLYGLILPSGADCSIALARLTYGSTENFVKAMNEKASSLGMTNTHYVNTHGLDEDNHYSTAYDQSLLMRYAIKNETFYKLITTMENKNLDLTHTIKDYIDYYGLDIPYILGGKTGTEDLAGYCLATIGQNDGINYMLITLNASQSKPYQFTDLQNIYGYYIDNFGYITLIKKDDVLLTLDTYNIKEEKIEIKSTKDYTYYLPKEYDKKLLKLEYDGKEIIDSKDKVGDKLGKLSVYYDKELLETIDVTLDTKVHFSLYKFLQNNPIIIFVTILIIGLVFGIKLYKKLNRRKKRKKTFNNR